MSGGRYEEHPIGEIMTKHEFNEVIVWDNATDTATMKNLCEKCGQREGEALECAPIRARAKRFDPMYLEKALKALAKAP